MKVLHLLPESPYPPRNGPAHHTYGLLRIAAGAHECHAAGFYRGEAGLERWRQLQEALPSLKVQALFPEAGGARRQLRALACLARLEPLVLRGYPGRELAAWLTEFVACERPDLVHVDQFKLAPFWDACGDTPRLLVPYDAFSLKSYRAYTTATRPREKAMALYLYLAFCRLEKRLYPHFDLVCPVSRVDAQWLARRDARVRVGVVEIPVADEFLDQAASSTPESDEPHVICGGWFSADGVAAGAIEFLTQALPRIRQAVPGVRVTLWGRDPTPALRAVLRRMPEVRHLDWVDDYIGTLRSAWVYVYPQACGAGIQTKVQQAMALGIPVVARAQSLDPLYVEPGKQAMLCDGPASLAEAVTALLASRTLRREVGDAGVRHMRERFSSQAVGHRLREAYERALAHRAAAR